MTALRFVIPLVAACEPESSAPRYASVSTILPEVASPPAVLTRVLPSTSRATVTLSRAKNAFGRICDWEPDVCMSVV